MTKRTRKCSRCGKWKPRTHEHFSRQSTYCRPCERAYKREYRAEVLRGERKIRSLETTQRVPCAPIIAEILKHTRRTGMSPHKFAESIGYAPRQLLRMRRGEQTVVSIPTVRRFLEALDLLPEDVYRGAALEKLRGKTSSIRCKRCREYMRKRATGGL